MDVAGRAGVKKHGGGRGVTSCSWACYERLVDEVLRFYSTDHLPGQAVFSGHSRAGSYCNQSWHSAHPEQSPPDARTLQARWVKIRGFLTMPTASTSDKGKDSPLLRWLVRTWGPCNEKSLQRLRDIAWQTLPPKRDKSGIDSKKARSGGHVVALNAAAVVTSEAAAERNLTVRSTDVLVDGASRVNMGQLCNGPQCQLHGSPPVWRHHCITCATAANPGPVQQRNYSLCSSCYTELATRSIWEDRTRPAFHPVGHKFTYVYNFNVRPGWREDQSVQSIEAILASLRLSDSGSSPVFQAARYFQPLFHAMYQLGVAINEACQLVSYESWLDMQAQCDPNIDLVFFYHRMREHEYTVFAFWANSNMFDEEAVPLSAAEPAAGTSLAVRFFNSTGVAALGMMDSASRTRLETDIAQANGNLRIQLDRFDFDFMHRLLLALRKLCPVFRRAEFKAICDIITDRRQPYWQHCDRLERAVRSSIDRLPREARLEEAMEAVVRQCGLPRMEGSAALPPDQVITDWSWQLTVITQQYTRLCLWRSCRLRLAMRCYEVVTLLVPLSAGDLGSVVAGLTRDHLELIDCLMQAYDMLRPPGDPMSLSWCDEQVVKKFMDSVSVSVGRLRLFISQLLDTKRRIVQPEPPLYSDLSHNEHLQQLRSAFVRLVSLYLFLARALPPAAEPVISHMSLSVTRSTSPASAASYGRSSSSSSSCLVDERLMQALTPHDLRELVEVPAWLDKYAPSNSVTSEVIRIMGDDGRGGGVGAQSRFVFAPLPFQLIRAVYIAIGSSARRFSNFTPLFVPLSTSHRGHQHQQQAAFVCGGVSRPHRRHRPGPYTQLSQSGATDEDDAQRPQRAASRGWQHADPRAVPAVMPVQLPFNGVSQSLPVERGPDTVVSTPSHSGDGMDFLSLLFPTRNSSEILAQEAFRAYTALSSPFPSASSVSPFT